MNNEADAAAADAAHATTVAPLTYSGLPPTRCKTCGAVVGDLWTRYCQEVEAAGGDVARPEVYYYADPQRPETAHCRALDKLFVRRACCRTVLLTVPVRR